jgi:hypothetical protein
MRPPLRGVGHLVAQVGLHHLGIAHHLGGRAVGNLAALVQHDHALHMAQQRGHGVLDPHHRQVQLVAQAADQPRHLFNLGFGQAGGHFVQQQHARARGQRHADLQQPLLRRRERRRGHAACAVRPISVRMPAASRSAQGTPCSSPHSQYLRGRRPANFRPNSMLASTGMSANTRGVWKVRASPSAAKRCGRWPGEAAAFQHQLAGRGHLHARDGVEERRLARAVGADDAHQLASA